jgi:hypothetical protein
MTSQKISLQQFVEKLQGVVGQPIWRVIHPADGWLFIDIGQQYSDTVPGKNGADEPYDKGQYQIHITGDWEVYSGDKLLETRTVNGADQKTYFNRMDTLVSNFPIKVIEQIKIVGENLIISGNDSYIKVPVSISSDSLSMTEVELSSTNEPIAYTHYRYEEEVGGLVEVSTKS